MSRLLILTGAGFSRNWGGLLTSEMTLHIASHSSISPEMKKRLLTSYPHNFETELGQFDLQSDSTDRLNLMEALHESLLFHDQLTNIDRSGSPSLVNFVKFIDHCDKRGLTPTWFTLNYDLLVERKWPTKSSNEDYELTLPGVRQPISFPEAFSSSTHRVIVPNKIDLDTPCKGPRQICYYKLHGSMNWTTESNPEHFDYIVAGDKKLVQLSRRPLLKSYNDLFSDYTSTDCNVLIIGYSFGDDHINRHLIKPTVTLHILDPQGISGLLTRIRRHGDIGDQTLQRVRSVWTRSFFEIFAAPKVDDRNPAAHDLAQKLMGR